MKNLLIAAALLISTSAIADEACKQETNVYCIDLDGDKLNDKVEFVVGMQTDGNTIHELNLKVSIASIRTIRVAHDPVEKLIWSAGNYTKVVDRADITKSWSLYISKGDNTASLQWFSPDTQGKEAAYYRIDAKGFATKIK